MDDEREGIFNVYHFSPILTANRNIDCSMRLSEAINAVFSTRPPCENKYFFDVRLPKAKLIIMFNKMPLPGEVRWNAATLAIGSGSFARR